MVQIKNLNFMNATIWWHLIFDNYLCLWFKLYAFSCNFVNPIDSLNIIVVVIKTKIELFKIIFKDIELCAKFKI